MALLLGCVILFASCSPTKHVPQGLYLLRSNKLKLRSDRSVTNKGDLTDALNSLIIQKPNTYFLNVFPYKVWWYNRGYNKYIRDTSAEAFQKRLKTVERPVVYDSALAKRSAQHMKSYLFNQGYFYSKVSDTVVYNRRRKAKATYEVEVGQRYIIQQTILDIDDSAVKAFVAASMSETALREGKSFAMVLIEEERSRIANVLRNNGYYKFTQDNIHIQVDTFNKASLRDADDPLEAAIHYAAMLQANQKPTIDARIIIRKGQEPNAYRRYRIGKVRVYPDFIDRKDISDSTMYESTIKGVTFRYHERFVREKVLLDHIFLVPGEYYTQDNYDLTITKLNELGLFQYVQTYIVEDTTLPSDRTLRCIILMNPTKRYDFSVNWEVTNGTTYTAGSNVGLNFRNRNMLRGANQLSISLTGGIELGYQKTLGNTLLEHFYMLSRNGGVNATVNFPKFIAPFSLRGLNRINQPRTILSLGTNVLERINYFTLINTSASINYNWQQNSTNTWDLSPAFINVLRLPNIEDTFARRLEANEYLKNSYSENFIEGENVSFTFSNRAGPNARRHNSFLKISLEEAGGVLSAINTAINLKNSLGLTYSQYVKIEADARHYIRRQHAELATRFFAGVGLPYDKSSALPYIKQYFVGGPYSLRGWRVRQLGPGSYYDSSVRQGANFIDRTGDIKLEANVEFRFDVLQLYPGLLLKGAVFVDAGNIWLAQPSKNYPGGEFNFSRLGEDLAVSTGLGARVDISGLFVLRIDEGIPLKNPGYQVNGGWIGDQVKPLDLEWLGQNIVLHIAIGYPF